MSYTDAFGMKVTYGRGEAKDLNGAVTEETLGAVHQISVDIDFDALGVPSVSDLTIRSAKIPAGAAILSARLVVAKAAATTATTVDVGTVKLNGTAIDEDGLIDGADLTAAVKTGAGALIGTINGTDDAYIKIAPSATTAAALGGLKGKLIVEYV